MPLGKYISVSTMIGPVPRMLISLAPPAFHLRSIDCPGGRARPTVRAGASLREQRRTAMAKGQKRSNREPKKPKADKKKTPATAGLGAAAPVKPKAGAATAGSKK
jgi:hypothetical protein